MTNLKRLLSYLLKENVITDRMRQAFPNIAFALDNIDDPNARITISSDENIDAFRSYTQPSNNPNKPNGVWYAFGTTWLETIMDSSMHQYRSSKHRIFQIENNGANIFSIVDPAQLENFHNQFKKENDNNSIDWNKVAANYDAFEIHLDPDNFSSKYKWLRGWDIPSGCIWKPSKFKYQRIANEDELQQDNINNSIKDWAASYIANWIDRFNPEEPNENGTLNELDRIAAEYQQYQNQFWQAAYNYLTNDNELEFLGRSTDDVNLVVNHINDKL